MAEIVLYHHVMGLTPGVTAFADQLRAAGHVVHTPDLFDAHTFTTLEAGIAHARTVGFDTIIDRGVTVAEVLGPELVYAGFSMGVMPLFFDSCLPVTEFGDRWPDGVPVQIHGMDADPEFAGGGDLDAAQALVDSTDQAELFLYPGDVHLFADSSLPTYDRSAAMLMTDRVLVFLSALT
jgi:dienelactone hydrolase